MILAAYVFMLVFDGFLLAGTSYLVAERGWSPWWFLFSFLWGVGCSPSLVINRLAKGARA